MDDGERNQAKDALDHAWRYFELHADQRMSMFNYFLVLFGFVSAGLAGCLQASGVLRLVGVVLGLALAAIAFTFWKLDQRTAFLVKHAECALCSVERSVLPDGARLFGTEPSHTSQTQAMSARHRALWTYGTSFRFVFGLAAAVGLAGAALALALYVGWCH
jgi:hypothetical protein